MPNTHEPFPSTEGSEGLEPDHEPERQPDDLDIEVSELQQPPLRPSGGRPRLPSGATAVLPWYRQSVVVPRPLAAAALVVILILLLLVALPGLGGELVALVHPTPEMAASSRIGPAPTVVPTATVTPYPTPTLVAPSIGPLPTDCERSPTGPEVGAFSIGVGSYGFSAVGDGAVWVDGFDGSSAAISVIHDTSGAYSVWGWPVRVALALKRPFTAVVTLSGSDVRIGAPLWWSLGSPGDAPPTPSYTIDPQQQLSDWSGDSQEQWWNGTLYLPGSGCYLLTANWPGGGWGALFAAGR